jgi:hypothetical protein
VEDRNSAPEDTMAQEGDLVTADEAASIAGVPADRLGPMVDEGLITVHFDDEGSVRFVRSEVEALRHLGG